MTSRRFPERLSKFLRGKLDELRGKHGEASPLYQGLARQYLRDEREESATAEVNLKHYEAEVAVSSEAATHSGMERLYRRTLVIEPTMACVAYCRFCLRSNYPRHTLSEQQLVEIAKYCGAEQNRDVLREVLITGGDPLVIPRRIDFLLEALIEYAPNVRIVRLATRIPTQDPTRIDDDVLHLFSNKPTLRFELATQINHPVELSFPESQAAFQRILAAGARVYSQNVLLKGINDDLPTLIDLYDAMRENNLEAHYLFHAIPMQYTHHLRTSVSRGLELANGLTSCGFISGRAKPMFAAMTDIGKITLYDGAVVAQDGRRVLLQSAYRLKERLRWNPCWELPPGAEVGPQDLLRVWYLDGAD
jgi:lysine 2,3-aminomutase